MSAAPILTVYTDYKSPYAFLAKDRVYALAAETGASIDWRPYSLDVPSYLGSATVGADGTVIQADRNAHQWRRIRYMFMDCRRQARKQGLTLRGTQKIWDSAPAAAGMLFAQQTNEAAFRHYHDTIFERFWKRNLDIENVDALAAVLTEAGADGGAFAAFLPEGLRQVAAISRSAEAGGVFGVPTFVVDGELFWGNEHLPDIRAMLACDAGVRCWPAILYRPSMTQSSETQFATFVATLGRGPGRSRALTRDEANTAFGMVLRGEADPHQVGAFLMLLRFRGEDPEEITGMVQATRAHAGLGQFDLGVDLDWPSYGAGRTRGAPWFLLAALALARSGVSVLMHGSNDFSSGIAVEDALAALGLQPAPDLASAGKTLRSEHFAYLPLRAMAPDLDRLLDMRRLFGLRSPVNTVARLLNPADAPAGVDGVFHPPYIDVHLGVAERMNRPRLLVLKGGGGEAERVPLKPATATVWDLTAGRLEVPLPAVEGIRPHPPGGDTPATFASVWTGETTPETPLATIQATIALALLAMGRADDAGHAMDQAGSIWMQRR